MPHPPAGWLAGWLVSSQSLKRERGVGASDSWAGPCDAGNDMRDDNRSADIKSPAAPTHTHIFAADYGGRLFISAYTSRVTSQNTYTRTQEQLWNELPRLICTWGRREKKEERSLSASYRHSLKIMRPVGEDIDWRTNLRASVRRWMGRRGR